MNNLLSYCGLVDAIRASDKNLPVKLKCFQESFFHDTIFLSEHLLSSQKYKRKNNKLKRFDFRAKL